MNSAPLDHVLAKRHLEKVQVENFNIEDVKAALNSTKQLKEENLVGKGEIKKILQDITDDEPQNNPSANTIDIVSDDDNGTAGNNTGSNAGIGASGNNANVIGDNAMSLEVTLL